MNDFVPEIDCNLEYVQINSQPIQVAQLGLHSSILKSFDPINRSVTGDVCLFFVPGEVGDITIYLKFLKNLYTISGRLPIIALSHAGHSKLSNELVYDPFKGKYQHTYSNESSILFRHRLFTIHGQIQSKLIFIKKFIPIQVRIFFVAHGIGAYMVLHMINSYPMLNVPQIHCIAPTIENVNQTPLGKAYLKYFKHYKHHLIDRLVHLYKFFRLFYLNWLFRLISLNKLVLFLYKKLFVSVFNQYSFVDSSLVPYLVLLLEDSISLIKDININLMNYLSSRMKMIYFTNDHLNYGFLSLANRRRFSLSTFLVSNGENLGNQTKLLLKRSNLDKRTKHDLMKEVDNLAKKTLNTMHDFQLNFNLCRLLSTHIAIAILNEIQDTSLSTCEHQACDHQTEHRLSFASKEDNLKSISRY